MNHYPISTSEIDYENLISFRLGNILFGINVESVLEVIKYQEPAPIFYPSEEIKEFIIGVIKYQGDIIPVVSLHSKLGLPEIDDLTRSFFCIVHKSECAFSLLVNEVVGVTQVDKSHLEDVPATISNRIKDILKGIYRVKNSLILVTTPAHIFSAIKHQYSP